MERVPLSLDELVEHWTLLDDERDLVAGKQGPTRLGFALVLKFYTCRGRFPSGRSELPDEAVAFVAKQMKVPASDLGFYEWSGRTAEYHRNQVREHLGFRVCSVADADKLTDWLTGHVAPAERNPDRVREELIRRCWEERIELPTAARITRIVRSALHNAEEMWFDMIAGRCGPDATARLLALICADGDQVADEDGEDEDPDSVLALIKSGPRNVSLESMLTEIRKLTAIRAVGLPPGLFADVAPKVVSGWRARTAGAVPVQRLRSAVTAAESHGPSVSAGDRAHRAERTRVVRDRLSWAAGRGVGPPRHQSRGRNNEDSGHSVQRLHGVHLSWAPGRLCDLSTKSTLAGVARLTPANRRPGQWDAQALQRPAGRTSFCS
jgi:Domain of unknown function (DUF4158)